MGSMGRAVSHSLSLHTLDGEFLDRTGPYPLIEQVSITIAVDGERQPPHTSGDKEPAPALDERVARTEAIARDIEHVLRNGAQSRVIADRATAVDRLTRLINAARGELLVLDRWFGQDATDWRLLDDVPVPVRVLTGKLERDVVPTIAHHVDARHRNKAPLHERVWLWDGTAAGSRSEGRQPHSATARCG